LRKSWESGTLFEDIDWQEMRSIEGLDKIILAAVAEHPGETRESIWFKIVQRHFMRYLKTEYRAIVQRLVDENKLTSPTSRKTKRLNDDCILHLP